MCHSLGLRVLGIYPLFLLVRRSLYRPPIFVSWLNNDSMKRHQDILNVERTFDPSLRRFLRGDIKYPWTSHGQSSHPFTTIIALGGCLFILIPANFASLFSGFDWRPFLSSFTAVSKISLAWSCTRWETTREYLTECFQEILFILVFIYFKYRRGLPFRDWAWLVSLSNYERDVKPVLIRLQAIREKSIPAEEEEGVPAPPDPNINTLSWWGRKRADWFWLSRTLKSIYQTCFYSK